jgi:hypothetical protein
VIETGRDSRRSYAKVLAKMMPLLEDSFGFVSRLVATVPWWRERARWEVTQTKMDQFWC